MPQKLKTDSDHSPATVVVVGWLVPRETFILLLFLPSNFRENGVKIFFFGWMGGGPLRLYFLFSLFLLSSLVPPGNQQVPFLLSPTIKSGGVGWGTEKGSPPPSPSLTVAFAHSARRSLAYFCSFLFFLSPLFFA